MGGDALFLQQQAPMVGHPDMGAPAAGAYSGTPIDDRTRSWRCFVSPAAPGVYGGTPRYGRTSWWRCFVSPAAGAYGGTPIYDRTRSWRCFVSPGRCFDS